MHFSLFPGHPFVVVVVVVVVVVAAVVLSFIPLKACSLTELSVQFFLPVYQFFICFLQDCILCF